MEDSCALPLHVFFMGIWESMADLGEHKRKTTIVGAGIISPVEEKWQHDVVPTAEQEE